MINFIPEQKKSLVNKMVTTKELRQLKKQRYLANLTPEQKEKAKVANQQRVARYWANLTPEQKEKAKVSAQRRSMLNSQRKKQKGPYAWMSSSMIRHVKH